jgi:hypothetical protein
VFVFALAQGRLGLFAPGDVLDQSQVVEESPRLIADGIDDDGGPNDPLVLEQVTLLGAVLGNLAGAEAGELPEVVLQILRVGDVGKGERLELGFGPADDPAKRAIGPQKVECRPQHGHAERAVLEDQPKRFLALPQRFLSRPGGGPTPRLT